MSEGNSIYRGCLFCKSGKEEAVVQQFEKTFPDGRAIVPTKSRYRRTKDAAIEERVVLLPGYVFFEAIDYDTKEESPSRFSEGEETDDRLGYELRAFTRNVDVLKLLRYSDGEWRLHGFDDQFAKMLFQTGGNIGVSQAFFDEGNRIRILDGFLKDYEGSIIRVNKKTRSAEVSIDLQGKRVSMWLGYELIEAADSGEKKRP